MELINQNVIKVGRVPRWIMKACEFFSVLLRLQDFKIHVHYANLKTANRFLRRHKIEPLTGEDRAVVFIDSVYLMAHIFFISPMKNDTNGLGTIAHEMIHIFLRYKVFNRVKNEIFDDLLDENVFDRKALNIEETAAEQLVDVLDSLGLFNLLKSKK